MAETAENAASSREDEVASVAWELEPLVGGRGEDGVRALLDEAARRAEAFAGAHAGKVAELDAGRLRAAMEELAAIHELAGRAGSYASLRFAVDTADPQIGALLQHVQERASALQTTLLFFELEWAALDDEHAEALLGDPEVDLSFCAHYLRSERRYRPYLLSEPEERVLSEKRISSSSAWARLFAELMSSLEVALPDAQQPASLEQALARLAGPDRTERRDAAEAVTAALAPGLRTRASIFNTLLYDKAVEDRLRGYPHWLAARNLANEASDASVQALVSAVRGRYDVPQRWYRLKARLLGLERLADYDRAATVTDADERFDWKEARELVLDAYDAFAPQLGSLAQRFFDERWIDAPVRPGKRGGAFCSYTVPSAHPYVLLNWTARRRDVLTLAHELGHGLHAALAAPQGVFHQGTPLTLAETASVFGETLVFGRLLDAAATPASRLALLAESIEGAIATVFRQTAMHDFEHRIHTERREAGELSVERFGELWAQTQSELFGDAVEVTEGYRTWWSYIPHFVNSPGYVYAYAYGQLLALSVYRRYRDDGAAFVPDYVRLLSAGGSLAPEQLGRIVGIDLADPGFWDAGLALVEEQLAAAEQAAHDAGRA
jgi:oligoendopeptidase F